METNTIPWVDLGVEGLSIVVADFEGSPGRPATVVRGDVPLTGIQEKALSDAGFSRMAGPGTLWARDGGTFRMREVRQGFPSMKVRETETRATQVRVRGRNPFETAEAATSGSRRIHADAVNAWQVSYVPGSKLGEPVAMIPVNMAPATATALREIQSRNGDIDTFVARCLDVTHHELEKMLSPEQVDAVAMGIDAVQRGREFLLADQTGLGKGRVLAAIALWAAATGKPVVFITEKANLFSDFWRDVTDIGADGKFGRPFLMNDGAAVIDVTTGAPLFEAGRADEIRRQMRAGRLPDGCGLMMSTYSQYNRAESKKNAFLSAVARDAVVITDEAHNASGDSNTRAILDDSLAGSAGVVRSSATFARRASALLSYRRALPASLRSDETAAIFEEGGTALAEALAQYLAEDGVLIRREHDLSDIRIEVIEDKEREERNRAYVDALAPILSRMAKLSRVVADEAETRNEEAETSGGKGAKEKWYAANFGSRLSPLIRQFATALSVDLCVERCIATLEAGEKPVVVIELTMEALMQQIASDTGSERDDAGGDVPDFAADAGPEDAPPSRPPDFRAALATMLDRMMHISVRKGRDDPEKVRVEDPFCLEEEAEILAMIESFPDLSLSPIDDIRDAIEAEGARRHAAGLIDRPWKADEISARKMRVREGAYEAMPPADRNRTIVAFNGGDTDAIILTRAASTGLSLHASFKVADQRRRRMLELQIPANVVERVQFWGRVNRKGQTSVPGFETLSTGLPFQARTMAMENRKVAALSANVSANSESASAMDVPDIIDGTGNEVARRILEDRPSLAERMCIAMRVDPEEAERELYFINKLLQRLVLLPSDEQDSLFTRVIAEYEDDVAALKAAGKTPRGLREMDGTWREVAREPYEAGTPADGPVFGRPVDLVTMEGTTVKSPLRADRVREMISASRFRLGQASGNAAGPFFSEAIRKIKASRRKVLNASLAGRFISVDSALATPGPNAVKSAEARLNGLMETLKTVQPGLSLTVPGEEGESRVAVITDVRAPSDDETHLPGRWSVTFAVPGDAHPKEISIATLLRDRSYELERPRAGGLPAPDLARFDLAPSGTVTEKRLFLDGNLVKAVAIASEAGAGSMVTLTEEDGTRRRSVLVSRRGRKALFDRSKKAADAAEALSVLSEGGVLFSNPRERTAGILVRCDQRSFSVEVPKGKEGRKIETGPAGEACGPFRQVKDYRAARVPRERIQQVLEALLAEGVNLHYDQGGAAPASPSPAPPRSGGFGRPGGGPGFRRR